MYFLDKMIRFFPIMSYFQENIEAIVNRNQNTKVESVKLLQLQDYLNSYHRIHGVVVLSDAPPSRWQKVCVFLVRFSMLSCVVLGALGASPQTSTNTKLQRIICLVAILILAEIILQESLFARKRNKIKEIVEWCHWIEMRDEVVCTRPVGWFDSTRRRIMAQTR